MSDPSPTDGLEVPSLEEGVAPEPVTDFAAEATEYKNRFAGSQKKLTETLNALKAAQAERDALAAFKAQAERANMTELEAAKADAARMAEELAAARAEAAREKVARKFPNVAEVLGDAMPTDETVLAALEQRLAAAAGAPAEPELPIDPNNPRKEPPTVDRTAVDSEAFADFLFPDRRG